MAEETSVDMAREDVDVDDQDVMMLDDDEKSGDQGKKKNDAKKKTTSTKKSTSAAKKSTSTANKTDASKNDASDASSKKSTKKNETILDELDEPDSTPPRPTTQKVRRTLNFNDSDMTTDGDMPTTAPPKPSTATKKTVVLSDSGEEDDDETGGAKLPVSENRSKSAKHKADKMPMPKNFEEFSAADKYLWDQRADNHTYESILPTYLSLAGLTSLGHSTLANRHMRLSAMHNPWPAADDALLLRAKQAVEAMFEREKWTYAKTIMERESVKANAAAGGGSGGASGGSNGQGKKWDKLSLKARWEVLEGKQACEEEDADGVDSGVEEGPSRVNSA